MRCAFLVAVALLVASMPAGAGHPDGRLERRQKYRECGLGQCGLHAQH